LLNPDFVVDRSEACLTLGISRQTLVSWVRKGKLKVWKRVGHGSNAALLFERRRIEDLAAHKGIVILPIREGKNVHEEAYSS
jgi:predicted site-specific integrase-resolvase